jgi:Tfp pilus assembly protein PilZ
MTRPTPIEDEEGVPSEDVLRKLRIPYVHKAILATGKGPEREAFTIDVGLSGVYVELPEPLPVGERVSIRFHLPGNEIPIAAACRVAWQHAGGKALTSKTLPPGVGLQFVELDDKDRVRVREHVLEHCRRHPRVRRFLRHWPETALVGDDPLAGGDEA